MVSYNSNTNTALTITSGTMYKVSELLGSDVAIKLEIIPQLIRYKENKNTKMLSDASALRFFL